MREYLLDDLLYFFHGKAIKPSKGSVPIYGSNGIIGMTPQPLYEDAIIIGRVGSCGSVERCKNAFWASDNTIVVKAKNDFSNDYCYYLLKTMGLSNYAGGAAQPLITQTTLKALRAKVPCLETQHRIAKALVVYDDLIENNQKQIKLLEEAAQRLYKEWFADLRFPGHEKTKIIEGIPEGWSYKPLSNIFDFIRGKSYTSKELSDTMGVLMVNLKNIRAFGGYKRNAEKRFTGQFKPTQNLTAGDLVMGVTDMTQERRLVGHVALVPDLGETMTFSMDLIKIIPKLTDKIFIYSALYYGGLSKQISPLANGVNVLHLKPEAMMGIEMLVPCDEIVRLYSQQVTPIFNRIEALQKQCDIAAEARDRLLPKLMSGEMEV